VSQRFYSTYQVADLLGTSATTVVAWARSGDLPHEYMPDGSVRISEDGLIGFLKRRGIDVTAILAKEILRYEAGKLLQEDQGDTPSRDEPAPLALPPSSDVRPARAGPDSPGLPPAGQEAAAVPEADARQQPVQPAVADEPVERPAETGEAVTQVAEAVLADAVSRRASHIHLQALPSGLSLRLRIDGVMCAKPNFHSRLPDGVAAGLVEEFKSMASLGPDVDAGSFTRCIEGKDVEFRLTCVDAATCPSIVIAIRPLTADAARLGGLGLAEADELSLRRLLASPHGLVLVSGPARAGLDAVLGALAGQAASMGHAVGWLGDPVRMRPGDAVRCPLSAGAAKALETLAAADTDVIVLERVPDADCVISAVAAAARGCLVLAGFARPGFHRVLAELFDAGPDPWTVASVLRAVVEVRTVRRLCDRCSTPAPAAGEAFDRLGLAAGELEGPFRAAVGCDDCGKTGYAGLTAVLSWLEGDGPAASMLRRGDIPAVLELAESRCRANAVRRAAIEKAREGLTSLEEVGRVFGG